MYNSAKISGLISALFLGILVFSCSQDQTQKASQQIDTIATIIPDTSKIPNDEFGEMVRYGRNLMLNTAYYIGPNGINGHYTLNKMNCTNCHQWAGTKPYSFNLMRSHDRYPQYRAREGKVISLADRINNCVTRPHNGIPLPFESKEMTALLCYYKWINDQMPEDKFMRGEKNLSVQFPSIAASPERGEILYTKNCSRCHGLAGEGLMDSLNIAYKYPPLWGTTAYQRGSSMHRVIKQAQWLKANMPHDMATFDKPVLTDAEALDLAAFVNADHVHPRPQPLSHDYPFAKDKAIDYDLGPFADTCSELHHKYGPYNDIIADWKNRGLKPSY